MTLDLVSIRKGQTGFLSSKHEANKVLKLGEDFDVTLLISHIKKKGFSVTVSLNRCILIFTFSYFLVREISRTEREKG